MKGHLLSKNKNLKGKEPIVLGEVPSRKSSADIKNGGVASTPNNSAGKENLKKKQGGSNPPKVKAQPRKKKIFKKVEITKEELDKKFNNSGRKQSQTSAPAPNVGNAQHSGVSGYNGGRRPPSSSGNGLNRPRNGNTSGNGSRRRVYVPAGEPDPVRESGAPVDERKSSVDKNLELGKWLLSNNFKYTSVGPAGGRIGICVDHLVDLEYLEITKMYPKFVNLVTVARTSFKRASNILPSMVVGRAHLISPIYEDCKIFKYEKYLSHVIRTNFISNSKTVLPPMESFTAARYIVKKREYSFRPVYRTSRWIVYEILEKDVIEDGGPYERTVSVDAPLPCLELIGGYRLYFADKKQYVIPNALIDNVVLKLSYEKVTPSILKQIKYYTRKYASDLNLILLPEDLLLITRIVLSKTEEMRSLSSSIYNNKDKWDKYNELLEFKMTDRVLPLTEDQFKQAAKSLAAALNIRESDGWDDITKPFEIKKDISTIKLDSIPTMLNVLYNATELIKSGKVQYESHAGGNAQMNILADFIKNYMTGKVTEEVNKLGYVMGTTVLNALDWIQHTVVSKFLIPTDLFQDIGDGSDGPFL